MTEQDLIGEVWKPVVGWEGYYEVSNLGRVKSVERRIYMEHTNRSYWVVRRGRLLAFRHQKRTGHVRVKMSAGSKPVQVFVHVLVLCSFVGACPVGMQCRHLDGNPQNNKVSNLKWGTAKQNMKDRELHGRGCKGEGHPKAVLRARDIPVIRQRIADKEPCCSIAADYGVTGQAIQHVKTGHTWGHLPQG